MTTSPEPATATADDRDPRARVLRWILIVAVVDLALFLPLIYGVISGDKSLTPIFGPLHGTGFMIEVGLTAWGAYKAWWGWWYPVVTFITTGPPGALLGHRKAVAEANAAA